MPTEVNMNWDKYFKFQRFFKLTLIVVYTIISQNVCAEKWDKHSSIWLYQNSIKLTLCATDKMGKIVANKSNYIQYIVTFQKGGEKFVAERKYDFSNPIKNSVTYPDDFHLFKSPSVRAIPISGNGKANWGIYIDGVLNASGIAETQLRVTTVNGHLVNSKGM